MRKKVLLAAAVVLACVVTVLYGVVVLVTNPTSARSFEGTIDVRPDLIEGHVRTLAGSGPARNPQNPAALESAADYIRSVWTDLGFEVDEQVFEVAGEPYRNLVIAYGPEQAPTLVVGAHYDACGEQPAADDNASAVAAILELARLLAVNKPTLNRRLELVAFTLEEPPFFRTENMGSAVHASSLVHDRVEVEGMMALEMLGYFSDAPKSQNYPLGLLRWIYPDKGDFICVVGDLKGRGFVRSIKARMAGACTVPVWSINAPSSIPGIDFSDHLNYWKHGFPAVMITDTAFYRNPNYHQVTDTPDTLDYGRLAEVVKGIYAAITT